MSVPEGMGGVQAPLLVFDVSGAELAVGIEAGGRMVAERVESFPPRRPGHASRLVPQINEVLREGGLSLGDLVGIAFTIGPGSYTGLRIGLATAKGFALASRSATTSVEHARMSAGEDGLLLLGVGTLAAIAWPHAVRAVRSGPGTIQRASTVVLASLDARRGQVYAAAYAVMGDECREVLAPVRLPASDAQRAAREAAKAFVEGGSTVPILVVSGRPELPAVAHLARQRLAAGEWDDPLTVAPLYVTDTHTGPVPGMANA